MKERLADLFGRKIDMWVCRPISTYQAHSILGEGTAFREETTFLTPAKWLLGLAFGQQISKEKQDCGDLLKRKDQGRL